MSGGPDRIWWIIAAAVAVLFIGYFVFVGRTLLGHMLTIVSTIQNWPQIRRAMVDAEARSGGRYPFWLRTARKGIILLLLGLVAFMVWRRFSA